MGDKRPVEVTRMGIDLMEGEFRKGWGFISEFNNAEIGIIRFSWIPFGFSYPRSKV